MPRRKNWRKSLAKKSICEEHISNEHISTKATDMTTMDKNGCAPGGAIDTRFGTCHQASLRLPAVSRGLQCTCIALMFIIFQIKVTDRRVPIDEILFAGDELYRTRLAELQSTKSFISKMLNFDELPRTVRIEDFVYSIIYDKFLFGILKYTPNVTGNVLDLAEGVNRLFRNHRSGLIIVDGLCSALSLNSNDQPVFFDSHSHGPDGLSTVDGRAIQITFANHTELVAFLLCYYESCNISLTATFDIQPLYVQNLSVTNDCTPTDAQSRCSASSQRVDANDSLLTKYFEDQERRKEYMKNYMKKRREEAEFKEKERVRSYVSKKKAREDLSFCEKELTAKCNKRQDEKERSKERERSLQAKRKARKTQEFCQKELTSKQEKRQDEKERSKERERSLQAKRKARKTQEFCQKELTSKQEKRQDEKERNKERERSLQAKRKARKSQEFCQKELTSKQEKRQDEKERNKERERTLQSMRKARETKEFSEKELSF